MHKFRFSCSSQIHNMTDMNQMRLAAALGLNKVIIIIMIMMIIMITIY